MPTGLQSVNEVHSPGIAKEAWYLGGGAGEDGGGWPTQALNWRARGQKKKSKIHTS